MQIDPVVINDSADLAAEARKHFGESALLLATVHADEMTEAIGWLRRSDGDYAVVRRLSEEEQARIAQLI